MGTLFLRLTVMAFFAAAGFAVFLLILNRLLILLRDSRAKPVIIVLCFGGFVLSAAGARHDRHRARLRRTRRPPPRARCAGPGRR